VGWSVLPLVASQAGVSLAAGLLGAAIPHPEADPAILLMSGSGGVLIVGLAFGLLELKRIRVAALLPALALAPLLYLLVDQMLGQ